MAAKEAPSSKYLRRGRRGTVCARPIVLEAGWQPRVVVKSEADKAGIRTTVQENILFKALSESEQESIVGAMERMAFAAGSTIIKQGDQGDYFYVLESGHCDIFVDGVGKVMDCEPGTSFGELALMYNAPRAASVVATVDSTAWALDQETFKKTLMASTIRRRERHQRFLEQVAILGGLLEYERLTVADALQERAFPAGATILQEGEDGSEFFIIESGEVKCTKAGIPHEVSPRLSTGSYFGERALLTEEPRAATVTAVTPVICQVLDRGTFTRLLGPLEHTFMRNMKVYEAYKDVTPAADEGACPTQESDEEHAEGKAHK